jgi:hypothetical protein
VTKTAFSDTREPKLVKNMEPFSVTLRMRVN